MMGDVKLILVLVVLVAAGCGVVEAPEPTGVGDQRAATEPAIEPEPAIELKACSAMDCDVLIGDSCPVCGKPELTCACYKLKGDGTDEVGVACAPPPGSMTCH